MAFEDHLNKKNPKKQCTQNEKSMFHEFKTNIGKQQTRNLVFTHTAKVVPSYNLRCSVVHAVYLTSRARVVLLDRRTHEQLALAVNYKLNHGSSLRTASPQINSTRCLGVFTYTASKVTVISYRCVYYAQNFQCAHRLSSPVIL